MGEQSVYEVQDFQRDVLDRSHTIPVVVDFWAEWCGPCRVLGPVLERLAASASGRWALAKVDTDHHQDIAAQYGIRSIPAVKLFIDGAVRDEFVGALPEQAVTRWLDKALPHPLSKEVARAEQMLLEGSVEEARRVLGNIMATDPDNEHAASLLARSLWPTDPARAVLLVKGIEEHSEFFPAAEAVRTVGSLLERLRDPSSFPADPVREPYLEAVQALADGNYGRALEQFISVIRTSRYYDDDGARKACIALFRLLGDDHELTGRFRREFSSALY